MLHELHVEISQKINPTQDLAIKSRRRCFQSFSSMECSAWSALAIVSSWNSVWYGFYGAFIKSTPQLCCLFIEDFNLISVRATLHLISQKSIPSAFSMKWFVYAIDLRQRVKVFTREGTSTIMRVFFGKHLVWSVRFSPRI